MGIIGKVDSLWRYPVKSMRGEELDEAFAGFAGIYGDRIFAFRSSASPKGAPYLSAQAQRRLVQCRPQFRFLDKAARPINLAEAESISPGLNPAYADAADLTVDVEIPSGEALPIDDPAIIRMLGDGLHGAPELKLVRSDRALTDCRPVSLISLQTLRKLGEEIGTPMDPRRFRANVYLDLASASGFAEDLFVGRSLRIGSKVVISILERDLRCGIISLDPDTGESDPKIQRHVARAHENLVGVYAAVLVEGMIRKGDKVEMVD